MSRPEVPSLRRENRRGGGERGKTRSVATPQNKAKEEKGGGERPQRRSTSCFFLPLPPRVSPAPSEKSKLKCGKRTWSTFPELSTDPRSGHPHGKPLHGLPESFPLGWFLVFSSPASSGLRGCGCEAGRKQGGRAEHTCRGAGKPPQGVARS